MKDDEVELLWEWMADVDPEPGLAVDRTNRARQDHADRWRPGIGKSQFARAPSAVERRRAMTRRARSRDDSRTQYIYDSQQLVAVLEPVAGGWRLIVRGREIGVFQSRAEALTAIDGLT
jgi:hypothetical protein